MCLTETKVGGVNTCKKLAGVLGMYKYQAWNISNKYFKLQRGYSGTAILSKTAPIDVKFGFGVDTADSTVNKDVSDSETVHNIF